MSPGLDACRALINQQQRLPPPTSNAQLTPSQLLISQLPDMGLVSLQNLQNRDINFNIFNREETLAKIEWISKFVVGLSDLTRLLA